MNDARLVFKTGLLVAALVISGCATTTDRADPLEGLNRKVFAFNDALDTYALRPVAKGYQEVTPLPARTNISNFFANVEDVWIGTNNLLQGKGGDALNDFGRFLINSTVGILGFFDVASEVGLEKHDEDFGQTLGKWGVASGPYLVLPFFGPRTLRDAGGLAVDLYTSPVSQIEEIPVRNTVKATQVVSDRAQLLGADDAFNDAAIDKYTYMRSFYLQRRKNLIHDGRAPREDEDDVRNDATSYMATDALKVSAIGYPASRQLLLAQDADLPPTNPVE